MKHTINSKTILNLFEVSEKITLDRKMGRLLGWLFSDCSIYYNEDGTIKNATIRQANHSDDIEELLGDGNEIPSITKRIGRPYYIWNLKKEDVLEVFDYFSIKNVKDATEKIDNFSPYALEGIFKSMMLGDGSKDSRTFNKSDMEILLFFTEVCRKIKILVGEIKQKTPHHSHKKTAYYISVYLNGRKPRKLSA